MVDRVSEIVEVNGLTFDVELRYGRPFITDSLFKTKVKARESRREVQDTGCGVGIINLYYDKDGKLGYQNAKSGNDKKSVTLRFDGIWSKSGTPGSPGKAHGRGIKSFIGISSGSETRIVELALGTAVV